MTSVCAFGGLPGGTWQIVHLSSALATGVLVIHTEKAAVTAASAMRIEPKSFCGRDTLVATISNFFIVAPSLLSGQVSYQGAPSVN